MRKALGEEKGKRKKFTATFIRLGKKTNFKGYSEETILLQNIIDAETQKVIADHVWFSYTKGFEKILLTKGITVEFEARVSEYHKGYVNKRYQIDQRKKDYKLSNPTRIKIVASSISSS